ncbi:6-phospho-3-hexuloisomerase [Suipraeoptans intestinalis]|uniref:6-phospho-3-hexuloisomerase n=1 Tax=Suipraeoptans intestinalis TaxID=2606628 RepID=A0A6N7V244_9FIRM|nr:6-phospho-3-hexuloisomerase [Suipraeoptans intestinalis]MDD7770105.1 6-phospho-3-hexuloisomerase [Suipraeoptans intestinalis]MDY3122013.1 6-phospho-3-hexuloisomerase [Suipraeoptans intestinalis]MSR94227.1 6-phospho-3-hexuloisomerase [Suipraeoptans intestinalis]
MAEEKILQMILKELEEKSSRIRGEQIRDAVREIQTGKRIFVAGVGRSGFVARAFSNRLMHLGLTVYVAGDATTPKIGEGDLFFVISGSGETDSLKAMAEKAKQCKARLGLLTIFKESCLGRKADVVIEIPGATPKSTLDQKETSIQPMGSAFEQLAWIVCDTLILGLMECMQCTAEKMFERHANLE